MASLHWRHGSCFSGEGLVGSDLRNSEAISGSGLEELLLCVFGDSGSSSAPGELEKVDLCELELGDLPILSKLVWKEEVVRFGGVEGVVMRWETDACSVSFVLETVVISRLSTKEFSRARVV